MEFDVSAGVKKECFEVSAGEIYSGEECVGSESGVYLEQKQSNE